LRRNCLLEHVTEGKIEGAGRRETRQAAYWMTLRKTQDTGTENRKHQIKLWRIGFGRQYGPVARQDT
jgi:hypothetical protein